MEQHAFKSEQDTDSEVENSQEALKDTELIQMLLTIQNSLNYTRIPPSFGRPRVESWKISMNLQKIFKL